MARHLIGFVLAALVSFSTIAYADAAPATGSHAKKSRVSISPIVFTKTYDKASALL